MFAADLPLDERVIIPEGRMIPLFALEESFVDVVTGFSGSTVEVGGATIPEDWIQIPPALKGILKGCGKVVVLGGVDSGKSSLSTLIANYFVSKGFQVSILDLDVGQSDVSLPAAIGLGVVRNPIRGLYEAEPTAMYFIGSISPASMAGKVIRGAVKLAEKVGDKECIMIVNTDGWLQGEEALNYKMKLVDALKPEAVAVIGEDKEANSISEILRDRFRVLRATRPFFIHRRTREERKRLREKAYYRYLRDGVSRVFPISKVEWNRLNLEGFPCHDINLLTGLIDKEGFMKGPGILKKIDCSRGKVLIYSRVTCPVEKIEAGLVRVKEDGCEIGQIKLDRNQKRVDPINLTG
ncbi:MAG: Clp1/GlmU family protein [Candidatus Bathyarchaeia archaeon]